MYLLLAISGASRSRCSHRRGRGRGRRLSSGPELLRLRCGCGDGCEALLLGPLAALPLRRGRRASAHGLEHEAWEVLVCDAMRTTGRWGGKGEGGIKTMKLNHSRLRFGSGREEKREGNRRPERVLSLLYCEGSFVAECTDRCTRTTQNVTFLHGLHHLWMQHLL